MNYLRKLLELEIANKLKILKIIIEQYPWSIQMFEEIYNKADEYENLIQSRLKK